jgi:hypothetical protein
LHSSRTSPCHPRTVCTCGWFPELEVDIWTPLVPSSSCVARLQHGLSVCGVCMEELCCPSLVDRLTGC